MNSRPYRQTARADAAAERTERILRAGLELFVALPFDQITLPMVAERAGVGLQTLLRRVGSKEGLVAATHAWVVPQIVEERGEPTADVSAAVDAMAGFNERWGELVRRTLEQAELSPTLAANAAAGRAAHRSWIADCFREHLAPLEAPARARTLAQLAAVTSTEMWLVLRRDHQLSVDDARVAVADLVEAALAVAAHHGASR